MRLLLLAQALAFWPVWHWYARRATEAPEGAWGLAGLFGAGWMAWRGCRCAPSALGWAPMVLTALYAAAFPFVSALPRALLALLAMASLLPCLGLERRAAVQASGFLVLSLPVFASLQFYLGYPLRVFCGEAAARLLHLGGYPVLRDGMMLRWQEHAVLIDAPCSGVKMLWAGLLLGLFLASARDLDVKGTAGMLAAAFGAVLLGNILRTTGLFFLETGMVAGPEWAHGALGALAFAAAAAALVALGRTQWLAEPEKDGPMRRLMLFLLACTGATLIPWLAESRPAGSAETVPTVDPAWPTHWDGMALRPLPLTEVEKRFAADFPGALARFSAADGSREILFRRVTRPTRKLHPSSDCLQASGYRISPLPAETDSEGRIHGRLRAERKGISLAVSEVILDADGKSWSDVSAWYWHAAFGKTRGPWLAVTVSTRLPAPEGNHALAL